MGPARQFHADSGWVQEPFPGLSQTGLSRGVLGSGQGVDGFQESLRKFMSGLLDPEGQSLVSRRESDQDLPKGLELIRGEGFSHVRGELEEFPQCWRRSQTSLGGRF